MPAHFPKLSHAYQASVAYVMQRTLLGYLLRHMSPRRWAVLGGTIGIVTLLSIYLISPFAVVERLSLALDREDIPTLKQEIPTALLANLIPNRPAESRWQGAGKTYLQQVWPQMIKEIDRHAWLSIKAQSLQKQHSQHYQDNLNHYVFELGTAHEQIRFDYQRQGLIRWQLTQVCYPNPQPELVAKRCPSSKR